MPESLASRAAVYHLDALNEMIALEKAEAQIDKLEALHDPNAAGARNESQPGMKWEQAKAVSGVG